MEGWKIRRPQIHSCIPLPSELCGSCTVLTGELCPWLPLTRQQQQQQHPSQRAVTQPYAVSARYAAARAERAAQAAGASAMLQAQNRKPTFTEARDIRLICPECREDPPDLVEAYSSGDLVCGSCGMVVGDRIVDTRSEWRTFANEDGDDPSRVGQATNPILDGLTESLETRISSSDGGSGLSFALQRATNRTATSNANRHILEGFDAIQNKVERMSLPRSAAEAAKQLFRRVQDEKIMRGRKTEAIIAAVLFVACKQSGTPRTFPEIMSSVSGVTKRQVVDCFKEIQATFELGQSDARPEGGAGLNITSAVDLINRFCNLLGLERIVVRSTEEIAGVIREKGFLDGRSPVTIAAACIYLTTTIWGVHRSTKRIAEATGVSPATIKGSYRDLIKVKDQILTPEIVNRSDRIDASRAVA
ncbi:cyclin-like protein [Microstroma glucosiphilum]|uniref:Transcription initiation factor IIB n=1 Tax=Pseudomicrostroma glucosiphilum TaxID=1684307 RepID=A0A316U0R2_9BASI|nr:cyclin-like protein [Pseudomicrostroma glucosiphilum]PWN19002.1 cyclin-like protein [Pseudomicrostroma glucosiphilum]